MANDLNDKPAFVVSVRALVVINFVLIAVSFTTWFSGTLAQPGFADRIASGWATNGLRWDVTWLIVSNQLLLLAFLYCLLKRKNKSAQISAVLIGMEFAAMIVYVKYQFLPNLYMG